MFSVSPIVNLNGHPGGAWNPKILFNDGTAGAWFDPSDLSTVFQDANGTTPGAVGSPVGLVLDKSRGLVRGAELNASGADLTPFGATETNNGDGTYTYTQATPNTNDRASWMFPGSIEGKWFEVVAVLSAPVATDARVRMYANTPSWRVVGEQTQNVSSTPKTFRLCGAYNPGESNAGVLIYPDALSASGKSVRVHSLSVRELPGNHASQSTSSAKPVLAKDAAGRLYLDHDAVDDQVVTNTPSSSSATVAYVTSAGETILTGQTVGSGYALPRADWFAAVVVNRALTTPETSRLTSWLRRRAGL